MSKINISFNNATYEIDKSALEPATANIISQLENALAGTGAVIHINGTSYNVDSGKLATETGKFTTHLGTIAGEGAKVVIGGLEYFMDADKLTDAESYFDDRLTTLEAGPVSVGLEFRSNGDGTCEVIGLGECTDTALNIPATSPDGDVVIGINYPGFARSAVSSVRFPKTLQSIGYNAFCACQNLVEIYIPDHITEISSYAFGECFNLKTVWIGKGVTSIEGNAFYKCYSIEQIYFNASITANVPMSNEIFEQAGKNGPGIDLIIGPDVKNLPTYLFTPSSSSSSRPKLKSITIEDGVELLTIPSRIFQKHSSLTTVTLSARVTQLDSMCFYMCTSLAEIVFTGTREHWAAVTKASDWNESVPATYVQCSDGQVEL